MCVCDVELSSVSQFFQSTLKEKTFPKMTVLSSYFDEGLLCKWYDVFLRLTSRNAGVSFVQVPFAK